MTVNRVSQSDAREAEAVQSVNTQKSQNTATKANAVDGKDAQVHGEPATQVKAPATAENNAGREQGNQQNAGDRTNGTRVDVFA